MKIENAMTVFKELPKTNCRECGTKTCLAFAGAVFQRQKTMGDCPHLDKALVEKFSDGVKLPEAHRAYLDEFKKMRHEIINVDLPDAAQRLGGTVTKGKLRVKVMGKDVSVDVNGKLYTDIHVNGWVERPVLTAIAKSKGLPIAGEWVKLHDLEGGKSWRHMFENQCVTPLHDLADNHPDLFETLMHVFSGSRVEGHMGSDIGVVLNVLPKVAFTDNDVRRLFEANTIDTEQRVTALKQLQLEGIQTAALLCPVIPYVSDVVPFIEMLANYTDTIWIYGLSVTNDSDRNWQYVGRILKNHFPDEQSEITNAVFSRDHVFWEELRNELSEQQKTIKTELRIHV